MVHHLHRARDFHDWQLDWENRQTSAVETGFHHDRRGFVFRDLFVGNEIRTPEPVCPENGCRAVESRISPRKKPVGDLSERLSVSGADRGGDSGDVFGELVWSGVILVTVGLSKTKMREVFIVTVASLRKNGVKFFLFMGFIVETIAELAENLDSAVVVTDGSTIPVYANTAFCELCGYSLEELIGGKPLAQLLPASPPGDELRKNFRENLNSNYPFKFKTDSVRKDGSTFIVGGFILGFLQAGKGQRFVAIERELATHETELFESSNYKQAVREVCNIINDASV